MIELQKIRFQKTILKNEKAGIKNPKLKHKELFQQKKSVANIVSIEFNENKMHVDQN